MNKKTDCCKNNTASQRHPRSSIRNNIFAYFEELQLGEKLNADQAKNILYLLHICIQSQKGLIFINNAHFEVVYLVNPKTSKEHLQSYCSK